MQKIDLEDDVNNTAGGVLAKLWRNIIKDRELTHTLPLLITQYVESTANTSSKNIKRQTKNTLINNIKAKDMTWKTFINLIINFLHVTRLVVSIKLTYPNGEESVHSVTIENSKNNKLEDDTNANTKDK